MSLVEPEREHRDADNRDPSEEGAAPREVSGGASRDPRAPRLRLGPPVATWSLILVLVLCALAQWLVAGGGFQGAELGSIYSDWALGAKVPSLVASGEYWRLITASFLHGSWLHLALNLLALLVFGRMVELFFGRTRMLVIFVLTCVSGAVVSYLLTPRISLGASTGVMGLIGALVMHHFKYRRYLPERAAQVYPLLLIILSSRSL